MDNHSESSRSYNMSRIHSKDTKPEEIVRKWLFAQGFRYRKNVKSLPGCPDIVLPKYKTVIFVNGCFWHMHQNCSRAVMPLSNQEYWSKKLIRNQERDSENEGKLNNLGWRVLTIWECELNSIVREKTLKSLINYFCDNWGD